MKKLSVAILGLGTVGGGAYHILQNNKEAISKSTGMDVRVTKILSRHPIQGIPDEMITDDPDEIFLDKSIDLVVESIGGIEPATTFMLKAMENKKHVVTANKAAVANSYEKLRSASDVNHVEFLFEASVGGGIPILTAIQNPLSGNNFTEVMGIINGTTNYILTKMTLEGADYGDVLKDAQEKGFAEADPTADVEGIDVANKLSILIALMFGEYIHPSLIPTDGISKITKEDIKDADRQGKVIKLIAHGWKENGSIKASVKPEFLLKAHPLAGVNNEFNAVYVTGDMVGDVMLYGKGAGALPTGSAVVGDIIRVAKKINDLC